MYTFNTNLDGSDGDFCPQKKRTRAKNITKMLLRLRFCLRLVGGDRRQGKKGEVEEGGKGVKEKDGKTENGMKEVRGTKEMKMTVKEKLWIVDIQLWRTTFKAD